MVCVEKISKISIKDRCWWLMQTICKWFGYRRSPTSLCLSIIHLAVDSGVSYASYSHKNGNCNGLLLPRPCKNTLRNTICLIPPRNPAGIVYLFMLVFHVFKTIRNVRVAEPACIASLRKPMLDCWRPRFTCPATWQGRLGSHGVEFGL